VITSSLFGLRPRLGRLVGRRPRVVAAFSFRYDAHLVPDLLASLRPIVDGCVAYDDRAATGAFSDEPARRRALVEAARRLQARWILFIDPDERHEVGLAGRIRELTSVRRPVVWGFRYRELYAPDAYRVDGTWGGKERYTLFPLLDGQVFDDAALHGPHYPRGYRRKQTGLNVYHLRMISPARRVARRDLYKALDPQASFQDVGYDYLADDDGMVLEQIPPGRHYLPVHREDGGLWAPALGA
jgi:hypothetical protein